METYQERVLRWRIIRYDELPEEHKAALPAERNRPGQRLVADLVVRDEAAAIKCLANCNERQGEVPDLPAGRCRRGTEFVEEHVVKVEYKRVEMNSVENVALVERMVERGWKIVRSNIFAVMLERRIVCAGCGE